MAYFSEHDLALISAHHKPASRFGFAVLLCYLKNVGFAPDKKTPSDALLKHIASRLKLTGDLWPAYLSGRDTTRREHLTELYRYLGVKAFTGKIQQDCITHLLPMATRTDKGILLTANTHGSSPEGEHPLDDQFGPFGDYVAAFCESLAQPSSIWKRSFVGGSICIYVIIAIYYALRTES